MLSNKRALGFKDVMIQPQFSRIKSRKDVFLERTFKFSGGLERTFVPVIASNMGTIGSWRTATVLSKYKMLTCLNKDIYLHEYMDRIEANPVLANYVACSVGLNDWGMIKGISMTRSKVPVAIFNLDIANGYMEQFIDFVWRVRKQHPEYIIMAGNVATRQGAGLLHQAGADIIKVGIGSGSVCTTRYKTGVGVPQVTAVNDVAEGWPNGPYVCSDGGCTSPGDVAKAFVAGADFVMLGGMFAGTVETGSFIRGSAWGNTEPYKTSEGKYVSLTNDEPKESLDQRVQSILGGLRSCGSYIGKDKIEDFYKAELIQVNEQTNNIFGPPS